MTDAGPATDAQPDTAPGEVDQFMPGPAELSVTSVLNNQWAALNIEQRGPDGSEVVMLLAFYACPLCNAVVAPPIPDGTDFGLEHSKWHIKQARDLDVINAVFSRLGLDESGRVGLLGDIDAEPTDG